MKTLSRTLIVAAIFASMLMAGCGQPNTPPQPNVVFQNDETDLIVEAHVVYTPTKTGSYKKGVTWEVTDWASRGMAICSSDHACSEPPPRTETASTPVSAIAAFIGKYHPELSPYLAK